MVISEVFDIIQEREGLPSIIRPKSSIFEGIDVGIPMYCRPEEVRFLAGFLHLLKGDYIEIGVNQGGTAKWICKNNTDKTIYGVDNIEASTMHQSQQIEQPNKDTVAKFSKGYGNFELILQNSWTVKLPENIEMIFIDADHRYEGVKNDTDNILSQMKEGWIFWHDYNNDLHPNYLGVNAFINNEIIPKMKVYLLEGTWLAFAKIG